MLARAFYFKKDSLSLLENLKMDLRLDKHATCNPPPPRIICLSANHFFSYVPVTVLKLYYYIVVYSTCSFSVFNFLSLHET